MLKLIKGSWFEFRHCGPVGDIEGKYWNPFCKDFTCDQWKSKIKEMSEIGIEYLVLMSISDGDYAFYDTSIFPKYPLKCEDPVEAILSAADEFEIKFFISNGLFTYPGSSISKINYPDETKRRLQAMNEIAEKYGYHESFYGWYWPHEAYINGYFSEGFIEYVNNNNSEARKLMPEGKILIAPYGTRDVLCDDNYIKQLEKLDVNIVAYQDEVGVKKSNEYETAGFYENLRKVHDKVPKVNLWADMEIFTFEGEVYKSALIPAPIERIKKQLESISPFVDLVLVYQYLGIMNAPDTEAFAGSENSTKLYNDYLDFYKKNLSNL